MVSALCDTTSYQPDRQAGRFLNLYFGIGSFPTRERDARRGESWLLFWSFAPFKARARSMWASNVLCAAAEHLLHPLAVLQPGIPCTAHVGHRGLCRGRRRRCRECRSRRRDPSHSAIIYLPTRNCWFKLLVCLLCKSTFSHAAAVVHLWRGTVIMCKHAAFRASHRLNTLPANGQVRGSSGPWHPFYCKWRAICSPMAHPSDPLCQRCGDWFRTSRVACKRTQQSLLR